MNKFSYVHELTDVHPVIKKVTIWIFNKRTVADRIIEGLVSCCYDLQRTMAVKNLFHGMVNED